MPHLRSICALLLLSAIPAFSQAVNGTIVGTVTDASGGAIVNGKVTLTEANTKVSRTKLTNEAGVYSFPDMPPGTYDVQVEMPGLSAPSKPV